MQKQTLEDTIGRHSIGTIESCTRQLSTKFTHGSAALIDIGVTDAASPWINLWITGSLFSAILSHGFNIPIEKPSIETSKMGRAEILNDKVANFSWHLTFWQISLNPPLGHRDIEGVKVTESAEKRRFKLTKFEPP